MPAADEGAWNCPECRTEQNQGLEQLARNFFLERTLESRKNLCTAHESPKKLRKYLEEIVFITKHKEF